MSSETPKINAHNLAPIDYSKLSNQQLLNEYNRVFNKLNDHDLNYISNKYLNVNLTKEGNLNLNYYRKIREWREKYINKLINHFNNELQTRYPKKQAPKIDNKKMSMNDLTNNEDEDVYTPFLGTNAEDFKDKLYLPLINEYSINKAKNELKPLSELDRLRLENQELKQRNQMLMNYIKSINNKLIQQQRHIFSLKEAIEILKKRNKSHLISEIPKVHNKIHSIIEAKNEIMNRNKEFLKEIPRTYEEWKKLQQSPKEEQDKLVQEAIVSIKQNPLNWMINLSKFNEYGKKKLTPLLIDVLENVVSPLMAANQRKVLLKYFMNSTAKEGKWISKPINYKSWNNLIKALKNKGLLGSEIMTQQPNTSDMVSFEYVWYWFDLVGLSTIKTYEKEYKKSKNDSMRPTTYKGNDGAFFAYWNKANLIDLSRYQVMNKNDLVYNQKIHKIPCVFYALELLAKDGIIPEDYLLRTSRRFMNKNKDEWKWTCNEYNMKHLNFACKELSIYCKLHYCDEDCLNKNIRVDDIGVSKDKAKYQIDLALYKHHFFIWEKTNYTRYYIQHYQELKNEKDANIIIGKRNNGKYQRDKREKYKLTSIELLREMMNNDLFELMNFKDILELEKETDYNTLINDSLKPNQKFVGLKTLATGELVPDIITIEEEEINESKECEIMNEEMNYINKCESSNDEDNEFETINYIDGIDPKHCEINNINELFDIYCFETYLNR